MIFVLLAFILSGSLSLKVTDAQNAVVPSARFVVYPRNGSPIVEGRADSAGAAELDLPTGTFLVEVEAGGFRRISRIVTIRDGDNSREEFSLQVAGVDSSVVVTASDTPQTIDQTTKSMTVITSGEILDRGEYALPQILSTVPGVQVRAVGGPGQASQLRVRGLRADATAILIDGMRFRDASTTQGDASSFLSNLSFISTDRIEMLRGSGSSLYGTNAAAGVVNIVSDEGGGPTHGSMQVEGGGLGLLRGRAQIGSGALGDRLKYSGGVTHLNVMHGVDGDDRARSTGGQALLRYGLSAQTIATVRFFGSDDFNQVNTTPTASGIPAANLPSTVIVPAVPLVTYIPGRNDPDSRRASRFYSTAVKFQHSFSPSIGFQSSYQNVRTSRTFENGPAGFGFQPSATNFTRLDGRINTVDVRWNFVMASWNQTMAGYEFERESYHDVQDNNLPASQRIRTETSIQQDANAVYFQNQSAFLGRRLQVLVSGRAQMFSLNRPVFLAAGVTNQYEQLPIAAPPKALTADLSLSYFIGSSQTKLRAHLGNAYRAPALYERFGGGFSTIQSTGQLVFSPWGDPSLRPDRYNSFDAGVDQYVWRDRVRVSSTYFYTRVASITAFDSSGTTIRPSTDPYGRSSGYINGSGGLSRGVELSIESRPRSTLTLSGSYTYTRAQMDRDITVPGYWRVLGIPRHAVTFVATQRFGTRITTAIDLVADSELFGNFTAAGRARAYRYSGLKKTDVSIAGIVKRTDRGGVSLNTRIENLFNRTYYDLGWPVPKLTVTTGLTLSF